MNIRPNSYSIFNYYSDDLDYILKEHVKILVDWINNGRGPFSEAYVNIWYKRYIELKNR